MVFWWSFATVVSVLLVVFSGTIESSWIEAVGMISAIVCIWDAAYNRDRNWPIGVVSCVAFFIIFANAHLYGNMALQVIFVFQAVWGQYAWQYGGERRSVLRINGLSSLTPAQYGVLFATTTIGCYGLLTLLNGTAPLWDTLIVILSIVANQLLIRRRVENWYLWLLADLISVVLFASQGLWITTATYVLYLAICIFAAVPIWRKGALV